VLVVVLAACGSPSGSSDAGSTTTTAAVTTTTVDPGPVTSGPRMITVVEENHSFLQIISSTDAPTFNRLAGEGVSLSNMYATTHPSLPNYLALTSGDTQGATNDCGTCEYDVDNLFSQLSKAHVSWRVYAQGYKAGHCAAGPDYGAFARRHVAALSYKAVISDPALCKNVVSFDQLWPDMAAGRMPTFSLVIPDLEHDMHGLTAANGSSAALTQRADTLAAKLVDTVKMSPEWVKGTRLMFTWDEGGGSPDEKRRQCCAGRSVGGHIPTFILGPDLAPRIDETDTDHYDILKSWEDRYHLPRLGKAAKARSHDVGALMLP
jgi:hypothetical protein